MDTNQLMKDIMIDEGLRLKPYLCSEGKLTIGYGRNIQQTGITKEEALYLLDNDLDRVEQELDRSFVWWRTMSDKRQRALANMCFNLGLKKLLGFKNMLAAMERKDFETAANEAVDSDWYKQVKDRSPRIVEMIRKG